LRCAWPGHPCLLPATAHAQDTAATVRWQIPASPLDQALTAFGQQSGLPIAADARLTRGRHSQGVQATLDADRIGPAAGRHRPGLPA
jgi:hemoglobin/transferrin/lactoferrin receptor protein